MTNVPLVNRIVIPVSIFCRIRHGLCPPLRSDWSDNNAWITLPSYELTRFRQNPRLAASKRERSWCAPMR